MGYNKKQAPYRNELDESHGLPNMLWGFLMFLLLGGAWIYVAMNQGIDTSEYVEKQTEDSDKMTIENFGKLHNPGCIEVGAEIIAPIQDMPRFPGCEDLDISSEERKKCAEEKLLTFVYGNLNYPVNAHSQGVIVINFTINKEGHVINSKILRNLPGGLGEEGLRVVQSMPQWIPAKQDGKPVNFNFNLPIRFKF